MTGRRGLSTAVLLCLVGAFVVLVGAGRSWTEVALAAGPLAPARDLALSGADLAGGVRALGLVGLAGVVALAATRRLGRVVVGVLLLLTGLGVAAAVLGADLTASTLASDEVARAGGDLTAADVGTTPWPLVTALGGGLLALAGLLTVLRGRSWPGLGQRYEAPAARTAPAPTERTLWEALDRGEDPTAR